MSLRHPTGGGNSASLQAYFCERALYVVADLWKEIWKDETSYTLLLLQQAETNCNTLQNRTML